jgi:arabinose-5-phosphate isomerase
VGRGGACAIGAEEYPSSGGTMDPVALFQHFVEAVQAAQCACAGALPGAVALVASRPGLVACTGAGKSGLVARKLASTLATGGRRAVWLDPGAAAHGEASLLGADDLLVAVSRSGESDEVVCLAQAAPCPVLALTARPGSRLGRAARLVLDCGAVSDPAGAAPSASYLAASAVADALALLVGPAGEPAHPAGAIGRARSIPVERVMHPPPVVAPDTPVAELLGVLGGHGLGAVLLVVDGALVGIVTDGDLRRAVARHGDTLLGLQARDIATLDPVSVRASASIGHALRLMEERPSQIAVLPVLSDKERTVGLVRIHDLVQAGLG